MLTKGWLSDEIEQAANIAIKKDKQVIRKVFMKFKTEISLTSKV